MNSGRLKVWNIKVLQYLVSKSYRLDNIVWVEWSVLSTYCINILTPALLRTEEDLGCEELSLCTELSEDQALLEDQGEEEHDLGEFHPV